MEGESETQTQRSFLDLDFFQFGEDSIFSGFDNASSKLNTVLQPIVSESTYEISDNPQISIPQPPKQYLGLSHNKSTLAVSKFSGLRYTSPKVMKNLSGFAGYSSASNITKKINQTKSPQTIFEDALTATIQVPAKKDVSGSEASDVNFFRICQDQSVKILPIQYGFVPSQFWITHSEITFGGAVVNFFQRKNHANARFLFKLLNALNLSDSDPKLRPFTGVMWLNDYVFRVDKRSFARLIGTKTIDNSLFHQQGNFPSHGFVEITAGEVEKACPDVDLTGVDFDNVRLIMHGEHLFYRGCSESVINECKWTKSH